METLFEELKRYVEWSPADEAALRSLHPHALPELERIASLFYARILDHAGARTALQGGESRVGQLKITLIAWMDSMLSGPWDEAYYERRARIGRVHVRINLPQHYMFGAMDLIRQELGSVIKRALADHSGEAAACSALGKILDLELAIMLHTYREDLIARQEKKERLATFGQLVGSIGHELRNPLGVIESSLYILKGRIGEDERARKHIDRIGEQLGISNQIISDLLDLIRDRPLDRERVRMSAVVDDAVAAIKWPAEVKVSLEGLDGLPEIQADSSKLRQVLVNLLDNASHAVGASGEVRVRGELRGDDLVLSVEDSGPGVDASVQGRLFEPLITTKAKGIGLGLPLVRRIVERHGGTVAYQARQPNGARFVITLPRGGSHA
jgi:signal transduction histidine kinase